MSPIRLLVSDSGEQRVIECMVSTDHNTGSKTAYVVEKNMIIADENGPLSPRSIAYKMITRRNSVILQGYPIYKTDDNKAYTVPGIVGTFHILQECMQSVITYYCERNNLDIIQIL